MKFYILLFFIILLNSCAAHRGQKAQDLQTRILSLEQQLEEKERRIKELEEELKLKDTDLFLEKDLSLKGVQKISPTPKRIQRALRNAGFYKGPIDGKIGPQTKNAIKEFQKANGLVPDGVVGRRTWEKLSKYLY